MSLDTMGRSNQSKKVHVLVTEAIRASGKSATQVAVAMGYGADRVSLIQMFMDGRSKLPINKVVSFAKAVGLDPAPLFEAVMMEYSPDTWAAIVEIYGGSPTVVRAKSS